jgi:hypothetical protein
MIEKMKPARKETASGIVRVCSENLGTTSDVKTVSASHTLGKLHARFLGASLPVFFINATSEHFYLPFFLGLIFIVSLAFESLCSMMPSLRVNTT